MDGTVLVHDLRDISLYKGFSLAVLGSLHKVGRPFSYKNISYHTCACILNNYPHYNCSYHCIEVLSDGKLTLLCLGSGLIVFSFAWPVIIFKYILIKSTSVILYQYEVCIVSCVLCIHFFIFQTRKIIKNV